MKQTEVISERPTEIIVDLAALAHNVALLKQHVGSSQIMAVVKADAYGHGIVPVARHLENLGVPWFGVAFVEEGMQLRAAGIRGRILVMGGISGSQIPLFLQHDLDLTAPSIEKLSAIDETAKRLGKRARVHLKIDTGMERVGVHYYSAEKLFDAALKASCCEIAGVYSHFARADEQDLEYCKTQLKRLLDMTKLFERRGASMPLRHISNSAGLLCLEESHLDIVRPGLCIYGISPFGTKPCPLPLMPVMTLRSRVVYFKVVKKGAGVSYGHRWTAPHDTRVVTIPIGYGDGYLRALSNKGSVLIAGKRYPIIGSICMDQMMVDIGPDGVAYNGDEVVLIGKQGQQQIGVGEMADLAETCPHEILVLLNSRIPRRYTA